MYVYICMLPLIVFLFIYSSIDLFMALSHMHKHATTPSCRCSITYAHVTGSVRSMAKDIHVHGNDTMTCTHFATHGLSLHMGARFGTKTKPQMGSAQSLLVMSPQNVTVQTFKSLVNLIWVFIKHDFCGTTLGRHKSPGDEKRRPPR